MIDIVDFWSKFHDWLLAVTSIVQSKNTNERFQQIIHHLNTAAKVGEEGISSEVSKHFAWLIYLLLSSRNFRLVLQKTNDLFVRLLFPLKSVCRLSANSSIQPFPHSPSPIDRNDNVQKSSTTDTIQSEGILATPKPSCDTLKQKPTAEEKGKGIMDPDQSNVTERGSYEENEETPSVDYTLPIDPTFYYQNSFPRLLGQEAKEEKMLVRDMIDLIDDVLNDSKTSGYPIMIINYCIIYLERLRDPSYQKATRPNYDQALEDLKV